MSERFTVERVREEFWPGEVVVLRDHEAGSWARIIPGEGANLIGFGARLRGRDVEVMLQPSDETAAKSHGQYGAPVLFPFAGRVRDGVAEFRGQTLRFDKGPNQAHAIHGLVRQEPFKVDRLAADADSATLTCSVEADANVLRQFPFPYRFTISFRLNGTTLQVGPRCENRGTAPLPMGFGWHPYFKLPLVSTGSREATIVQVPAGRQWELEPSLMPSGDIHTVPADRDFRAARPIGSIFLDDVYTGVPTENGANVSSVADPSGIRVSVAAGPSFREWVIYAPPTRPTICLEPYTGTPDIFNLAEQGLDVGLIVVEPGQSWDGAIALKVEET